VIKNIILLPIITLFLTSCNLNHNLIEIDGKWDLYKNKFIKTEKIENNKPDYNLYLSGSSIDKLQDYEYLYGTVSTEIDVTVGENYTLYTSGFFSSSRIWIDDVLVGQFGEVSDSIKDSTPVIKRALMNFVPKSDKAHIVIEFSNFHFKNKWLFKWMLYGKSEDVIDIYIKSQSKDYFTTGLLLICSVLFILMFLINIKNKYNLYFSLFTLSYGIRSYLIKNTTIQDIIPWVTWVMEFQFNKASELWALTFILLFFTSLYPLEFKTRFSLFFTIISLASSFLAFLPLNIFNKFNILTIMHIEVLIAGTYIISKLVRTVKKRRKYSLLALTSIVLFFLSIVFDIVSNTLFIAFDYYSAQFVIIVVITMFIMIGQKRVESTNFIKDKERINANTRVLFSKFVPITILKKLGNMKLEDRDAGEFIVEPVTMVYIDIRDFTKLSESLTPKENFTMINDFYDIVGNEVVNFGGYIESYGGDGVRAIFECPPDYAVKATLKISDKVASTTGIRIGMSLHFGRVVLGTIGSKNRVQATAVSEVTRVLGYMDSFNSKMGIEILITKSVYALSSLKKEDILTLGDIILKGEDEPITLYQVIPKTYILDPLFKEAFENGVKNIALKNYPKAYGYFSLAANYNNSHILTKYYLKELDIFFKLRGITFNLKV